MQKRVFALVLLLVLRIIIGFVINARYYQFEQIRVTGKVIRVIQIDNNCIIDLGVFRAKMENRCAFKKGEFVRVVGRPTAGLIELLGGKILLNTAIFDYSENKDLLVMRFDFWQSTFGRLRDYCREVYQRLLPRNESALLAGIVLGDKESIGYDFYQNMVRSGTIHVAVASGYNLMLVGGVILNLLFWIFERKKATIFAVLAMACYAVLAGFEPPVVRALIMSSLLLVGAVLGRKTAPVWFLIISAWVMLVWDMDLLWNVSFQLSVMASVGLMVFAPWVQEIFRIKGLEKEGIGLEKFGLITTVCTMLATAPVIWWHFGRISIIGVFSNVFILPLVPPVMILGVFTLLMPGLFFVPTYALVHLMVLIINFFGT